MGGLNDAYDTLRVRHEDGIAHVQIHRPEAGNAINDRLVQEMGEVLQSCADSVTVLVLEGLPDVFCSGADFGEIADRLDGAGQGSAAADPGPLYDLWLQLATGPYVSVAHVRGRVNAGGVGFVAACDIVLSEDKASFSLSELLFGLMPACVLPFLRRRTGVAKANFLTLMTQPISAGEAQEWGLVDACEPDSQNLLRKRLLRLRRLGKEGVARYKQYAASLDGELAAARPLALQANREVFSDTRNLHDVARYVRSGKFPWEAD